MKNIIFLFLVLVSSFAFGNESFHADVVVKPGDAGSIVFPVKNSSLSLEAMKDAEVEVSAPYAPYFVVQDTSLFTNGSISVADTFLSRIDYKVETNAPHGEFDVIFGVNGTNYFMPVDGVSTSVCTIKVSCMEVVVTPVLSTVAKDESGDYIITVKNLCPSTEKINISLLSEARPDWSVSDLQTSEFTLQSEEEIALDFSVYNSYAISPIEIVVMVEMENRGSPEEIEIIVESGQEHKNDHPDDTHAITSADYPSFWLYDSKADMVS